jgi:hypothetical protein
MAINASVAKKMKEMSGGSLLGGGQPANQPRLGSLAKAGLCHHVASGLIMA